MATGYESKFPSQTTAKNRYQLFTLWSAPNYGYVTGNQACVVKFGFGEKDWFDFVKFGSRVLRIEPEERGIQRHYFLRKAFDCD